MDNKRYIEFGPEDGHGNVLVTMGKVNAAEEHRIYLIDQVKLLNDQTWAILAKKTMTQDQRDLLEEACLTMDELLGSLESTGL